MKNIAVITSGGDSSGINAFLRGFFSNDSNEILCFNGGYDGIINTDPFRLTRKKINESIYSGMALVRSARSKSPLSESGRKRIIEKLQSFKIDVLVVCGGDGSAKAAQLLQMDIAIIFIPMTIDNNIFGTDYTIGFNTAVQKIADDIKNLRQTGANLQDRIFMLEVAGGYSGQLALSSAIAGNADIVLIPEFKIDFNRLVDRINDNLITQQQCIIVNCETNHIDNQFNYGNQGASFAIGNEIDKRLKRRIRYAIPGYTLRAGETNAQDINRSIRIGVEAARLIQQGNVNVLVGIHDDLVTYLDIDKSCLGKKVVNIQEAKLATELRILDQKG